MAKRNQPARWWARHDGRDGGVVELLDVVDDDPTVGRAVRIRLWTGSVCVAAADEFFADFYATDRGTRGKP
jgi:hypothetical protein